MRYSGYYTCRECGKVWKHKSDIIPFELVDWWYSVLFLYHIVSKHTKLLKFKHIVKAFGDIFLKLLVAVMFIIFTIIQIVLYPFKLLIDLFY